MVNSIFAQGRSIWNTIEDNVKSSSSLSIFKRRQKDQYLKDIIFFVIVYLHLLVL